MGIQGHRLFVHCFLIGWRSALILLNDRTARKALNAPTCVEVVLGEKIFYFEVALVLSNYNLFLEHLETETAGTHQGQLWKIACA